MENLRISSENIVGGGGNSDVYLSNLDSNFIIKRPKFGGERRVRENVKNYELIKNLGLATLEKFEVQKIEHKEFVMVGENLNKNEGVIYVSPNSIHPVNSSDADLDKDEYNDILRNMRESLRLERINEMPIAERFRYENKLAEIVNLQPFIEDLISDLKRISFQKVYVAYDAYFYGSEKYSEVSTIDYKIADFDDIVKCDDLSEIEVYSKNIDSATESLMTFISYFVIEKNIKVYHEQVKNIMQI